MRDPYFADDAVTLYLGDCLDVLRTLPAASVDAVVTDPPYALAELATTLVVEAIAAWMRGDRDYVPDGGSGFMGRRWDRFVPPPGAWDECMRVLKPGGHLLAFAGARTVDLMGLSIRIAGFEIRDSIDQLSWIYGSGFPKSLDVSKAIDKASGATRQIVGQRDRYLDGRTRTNLGDRNEVYGTGLTANGVADVTAPATAEAAHWEGWGTALKPAHEPIVVARKPLAGTVVQTVLEHGTGALNIAACRTPGAVPATVQGQSQNAGDIYGTDQRTLREFKPHHAGRWPTNVVLTHPPLVVDGEVVGDACASGCVPGCPVAELDRQSGISKSSGGVQGGRLGANGVFGEFEHNGPRANSGGLGDTGGASRFFPTFRYEAKAPASERPRLPDGTTHTTVKPLTLMRWLVRLVTPPGGTVLDPFAGSGTTGEAAVIEGFRAVLIEREAPYAELIKMRLAKPIAPALDLGELT